MKILNSELFDFNFGTTDGHPIADTILLLRSKKKSDFERLCAVKNDPLLQKLSKEPQWIVRDRQYLAIEIGAIAMNNLTEPKTVLLAIRLLSEINNGSAMTRLSDMYERVKEDASIDETVKKALARAVKRFYPKKGHMEVS